MTPQPFTTLSEMERAYLLESSDIQAVASRALGVRLPSWACRRPRCVIAWKKLGLT